MEADLTSRLAALSHPQRLSIFKLLMRRYPDKLPAGEVARVLGYKSSTTSVYLAALARVGLIRQERQGTFLRYEIDIAAARSMVSDLFLDCCKGRPDLCPPFAVDLTAGSTKLKNRKYNVLFICTGNSVRSIVAEAILRDVGRENFNAYSAGSTPKAAPNPLSIDLLKSRGIETSHLRSKSVNVFQEPNAPVMDFVFTVCDRAANEECPAWKDQPISAHWGLPDPAKVTGTEAEKRLAFQQVFGALANRIKAFTALPIETLDRVSLQEHIDSIGRSQEII